MLPVSLILLWEYSWYLRRCVEAPRYYEIVLATVTICLALWTNHLRAGHVQTLRTAGRILGGALADLLLLFVLVMLFGIPAPAVTCASPQKLWGLRMYSATDEVRGVIATRILQRHSVSGVGNGLHLEVATWAKTAVITGEGMIVVASDDPPAMLVLRPVLAEGKVNWTCVGTPTQYVARPCP